MNFKKLLSMVVVAGMMLTGCQSSSNEVEQTQGSVAEEISTATMTNEEKEQVEVEEKVTEEVKVVAATVSATQVLAELNAEVLGVPVTSQTLPEVYADLPTVGQAMNPDLEVVASLEPDLLIMDANFKASVEDSLDSYGINAFFFETGSYEAFTNSIEELGKAINREEEAASLVSEIKESEKVVALNRTEISPTVAVIFGAGDNFMLATESSYLGDLVKTVGATNITSTLEGDMSSAYVQFSLEQILAANPDYGSYEAFTNSIEELGKAINREEEAASLVSEIKESEKVVALNRTEISPTVAVIFGAGDNFMLATESSYLGDLVKTVGATNITSTLEGDMSSAYVQFSLEQILAANPDYVLRFAHGNIEETSKMFNEAFDKNEAYQELDAVKNGKVYDLDSSIFNVSANLEIKTAITTLGDIFYGN